MERILAGLRTGCVSAGLTRAGGAGSLLRNSGCTFTTTSEHTTGTSVAITFFTTQLKGDERRGAQIGAQMEAWRRSGKRRVRRSLATQQRFEFVKKPRWMDSSEWEGSRRNVRQICSRGWRRRDVVRVEGSCRRQRQVNPARQMECYLNPHKI